MICFLLLLLVFCAGMMIMLYSSHQPIPFMLPFSGVVIFLSSFFCIVYLLPGASYLRIDDEGFEASICFMKKRQHYKDIARFAAEWHGVGNQRSLKVVLFWTEAARARQYQNVGKKTMAVGNAVLAALDSQYDYAIPVTQFLPISQEVLADKLNSRLAAWRARQLV